MNEKHASRLFWAIKALLAGILLYVAVAVIVTPLYLGRSLKPRSADGDERSLEPVSTERQSRTPADLSAIVENDLFAGPGSPALQTDPRSPSTPNVLSSEEELGLKLIGTVAGDSVTSRAVIQIKTTGVALPYKVGDMVGAATVETIESDRVVVRVAGRRKVLPRESGAINPAKDRPSESKPQSTESTGKRAAAEQPPAPKRPQMRYVEEVFHKAKIEPYVRNGRTEGLKITGLESTPLTDLFGLKNGDVVQTVNGQTLTSKQKAFQVLQKAKMQSKLQIQVLRDGKAKELSFDMQ